MSEKNPQQGEKTPYFYVENEYYYDGRKAMKQKSIEEYVKDLSYFINGKNMYTVICDPSASSLIVSARQAGFAVQKANNDVDEGIKMVYALLANRHILINKDNCKNLVAELGLYVWDDKKSERGKEEPVKANDHACDALRYFIATTTSKYEVF